MKHEGQGHARHRAQRYTLELHRADAYSRAAQAHDEHHGGQDEIGRSGIVHSGLHQHADARSGNDAEKQDADTAHDRSRNGADEGREHADKGQGDGQNGRPADDPHGIDPDNGQVINVEVSDGSDITPTIKGALWESVRARVNDIPSVLRGISNLGVTTRFWSLFKTQLFVLNVNLPFTISGYSF